MRKGQDYVDSLRRLKSRVFVQGQLVDNLAEQRALGTAGFQREGVLRHAQFRAGEWRDVVLYSRLRHDPDAETAT